MTSVPFRRGPYPTPSVIDIQINGAQFQLPYRVVSGDEIRRAGYVSAKYDLYLRVLEGPDLLMTSFLHVPPKTGRQFYTVLKNPGN